MDAERLTPPSPTRDQVIQQRDFAVDVLAHYDDEFLDGVRVALTWILGEHLIPPIQIPDRVFFD